MDERLIQQQEQELAKTGRYYLHVCFMTIPLLCMACFLYGLRPLLLCGAALLTGNLCDRLVSLLAAAACIGPGIFPTRALPHHRTAHARHGGLVCGHYGGACRCPHRQGGVWRLRQLSLQPAAVATPWRRCPGRSRCSATPSLYQHPPVGSTGVPVSSTISDTLRSGGSLNISAISLGLGEYAAPMGTGAASSFWPAGFSSGCKRMSVWALLSALWSPVPHRLPLPPSGGCERRGHRPAPAVCAG